MKKSKIWSDLNCDLVFLIYSEDNKNMFVIHVTHWLNWNCCLIFQARTFLLSLKNTFYLMLCYHLSVTLVQVLASLLLLPPVLAPQQLLWLLIFVIPLISLSMMGNAVDFRIMNNATVKYPKNITIEVCLDYCGISRIHSVSALMDFVGTPSLMKLYPPKMMKVLHLSFIILDNPWNDQYVLLNV